jgi:phage terminase large subunit-like protein
MEVKPMAQRGRKPRPTVIKELEGNPVLRWMMDNIYVKTDPAGNIKPDKEKSTERIDGVVALIMALDRAIRNENKSNIYDERGILVL